MNKELIAHKNVEWTRSALTYVRKRFVRGLVVAAPLAITIWVLWALFWFVDNLAGFLLGKAVAAIPGVGIVVLFLLILLSGIVANDIVGKRMISYAERVVSRVPLANKIYAAIQQIAKAFIGSKDSIFSNVVIIEYPRKGIYSLGLLTSEGKGEIRQRSKRPVVGVFLLTTPNPTTGILVYVPKEEVIYLDMSIEDSLKQVISGGVYSPTYEPKQIEAAGESVAGNQ
jgi:uncharacterized membrane protein